MGERAKAWVMGDEDTVAAETREQAVEWYCGETGFREDEVDVRPATESELDQLITIEAEEAGQANRDIPLRQVLADLPDDRLPCIACSTEW